MPLRRNNSQKHFFCFQNKKYKSINAFNNYYYKRRHVIKMPKSINTLKHQVDIKIKSLARTGTFMSGSLVQNRWKCAKSDCISNRTGSACCCSGLAIRHKIAADGGIHREQRGHRRLWQARLRIQGVSQAGRETEGSHYRVSVCFWTVCTSSQGL